MAILDIGFKRDISKFHMLYVTWGGFLLFICLETLSPNLICANRSIVL